MLTGKQLMTFRRQLFFQNWTLQDQLRLLPPVYDNTRFFFLWRCDPTRVMASSFLRVLDYTQRRNTVGRSPLDEWSARRRDLYLTTHNTHNRQTSMPLVGFEPTISEGEQPQTYASDRAATGTGTTRYNKIIFFLALLRPFLTVFWTINTPFTYPLLRPNRKLTGWKWKKWDTKQLVVLCYLRFHWKISSARCIQSI